MNKTKIKNLKKLKKNKKIKNQKIPTNSKKYIIPFKKKFYLKKKCQRIQEWEETNVKKVRK